MKLIDKIKRNLSPYNHDTNEELKIVENINSFFYDEKYFNDKKISIIIGNPGTGKTHFMIKNIMNFCKEDEFQIINHKSFDFTKTKMLLIDGWNEIPNNVKKNILNNIDKLEIKKIIITSWYTIYDDRFLMRDFYFSGENDSKKLASYYKLTLEEEQENFYSQFTNRQLHTIFSNVKQSDLKNIKWDSLQKIFENIFKKNNFKDVELFEWKNPWWEFKEKFVKNNKNFPFIREDLLTEKWKDTLKKFSIIQKNDSNLYFINNYIFLSPILFRNEINKIKGGEFSAIENIEIKWTNELFAILIFLAISLKNSEFLVYLIKKYGGEYNASIYAKRLYDSFSFLKIKSLINWSKIKWDTLFSLQYLAIFMKKEEYIDVAVYAKNAFFFGNQKPYANTFEQISLNKSYSNINKIITCSLQDIYSNNSWGSDTMKMINRVYKVDNFPTNEPIELPIPSTYPQRAIVLALMKVLKEYNIKIIKYKEIENNFSQTYYIPWCKERGFNSFLDFEDYVHEINKINFDKKEIDDKNISYKAYQSAIEFDKTLVESTSLWINKNNSEHPADKYTNKFLSPFLSYVYNLIFPGFFEGKTQNTNSYLLMAVIGVILNQEISSVPYHKNETPFLIKEEDMFSLEVDEKMKEIKELISKPLFLNYISMEKIMKRLPLIKNGKKWFPICFSTSLKNGDYKNFLQTTNLMLQSINEINIKNEDNWFIGKDFFSIPTKESISYKNINEFIIHNDKTNGDKAIYTINKELLKRFYNFCGDSTSKNLSDDYQNQHIVINWETMETYPLEEYKILLKKDGFNYEWMRFALEEEIKKTEEEIKETE